MSQEINNFKSVVTPALKHLLHCEALFRERVDANTVTDTAELMSLIDDIEQAEHKVWEAWAKVTESYNRSLCDDLAKGETMRLFPAARKLAFRLCDM